MRLKPKPDAMSIIMFGLLIAVVIAGVIFLGPVGWVTG